MVFRKKQLPKVNFYDGQRISESDLDAEQLHTNTLVSSAISHFHGSGVVRENPFEDYILLNTSNPGLYGENPSQLTIESGSFDGVGIYLDRQPSDSEYGNRIEIEAVNLSVMGRLKTKILIIGKIFDGSYPSGYLTHEFVEIGANGKYVTKNSYKTIYGVLFNHFSGGSGSSTQYGEQDNLNLSSNGGYIIFREATALSVYSQAVVEYQTLSPNIDFLEFIFRTTALDEIGSLIGPENNIADVTANIPEKDILTLEKNANISKAIGQKFLLKTDNIQRVDVLISSLFDDSQPSGEEYNFSGNLVLSVYKLSSEISSPTDVVPTDLIDFPPDATPLAQISMSQSDLLSRGITLNSNPQRVPFDFSASTVAATNSIIEPNSFYAFMLTRSIDNTVGTIQIYKGYDTATGKENLGIPLTTVEQFAKQTKQACEYDPSSRRYIDDKEGCLWFKTYSSSVEVVAGFAYTEDGVAVNVPKTKEFVGGIEIPYSENSVSLKTLSSVNYVVLSHVEKFTEPSVHPRSGNLVYTRILDTAKVTVYTSDELIELSQDSKPLILAKIQDNNIRYAQDITGSFSTPGLVRQNEFLIKDPSSSLLTKNLVGMTLSPDVSCACDFKYNIIKTECINAKTGDLNSDGRFTSEDLLLATDLSGNSLTSETTVNKLVSLDIDIIDFIKADCNGDGTIDGTDISLLEAAIASGTTDFSTLSTRYLKLFVENSDPANDYPIVFTDTTGSGVTNVGTSEVTFNISEPNKIVAGNFLIISGASADNGTYTIVSKEVLTSTSVKVIVVDSTGSPAVFAGTSGFNPEITSSTSANMLVNHTDFITYPFGSFNYSLSLDKTSFSETAFLICDLRRYVSGTYTEEASSSCVPVEESCGQELECTPQYKNQTYIPDDLYLPSGDILQAPGVPHHGDWEYSTISIPMPEGTLTECSINLYENFVKSYAGTDKTVTGFPAMKFSDGTLVGCQDSVDGNDITKGRVKFSQAIASIYADSVVFQIGVSLDPSTGIATFSTANILYSDIVEENRTVIKFGVFLKKAGFKNSDLSVSMTDILRIGFSSCLE